MFSRLSVLTLLAFIMIDCLCLAISCQVPNLRPYPKSQRSRMRSNKCTIDINFESNDYLSHVQAYFERQLKQSGYDFAYLVSQDENHFYALYQNEERYTTLSLDRSGRYYRFELDLKARAPNFIGPEMSFSTRP